MANPKLLIVEDDEGLCSQYRWAFPACQVMLAHARAQAVAMVKRESPPVVLMDLGLPPDPDGVSEGFATLEEVLRLAPQTKVIVVTGNGERRNALRAIAAGAYDFCEKPIELEVLRTIIARGLNLHRLEDENRRMAAAPAASPIERIITASPAMLKVCRDIEKVATTSVPVLLLGESGTGKEALARAVHDLGPRAKQPFVAINCGAIPENLLESELFGHERGAFTGAVKQTIGKIENAHRGTLFLDEIGDFPYPLQVKLLRFLQDQIVERIGGRQQIQVDVRIVSATNLNLDEKIAQGQFRGDLLYRMNAVTVRIPPLRERGGDIALLAGWFLNRFNQEFGRRVRGFTERATAAMTVHEWPGNVRELENRLKRAVVMADGRLIDAADLELAADDDLPDLDLRAARLRAEREVISAALARSNNTLSVAAKLLGVSRPTLYGLLETHGLASDATGAAAAAAAAAATSDTA
ncbi:PEP-CTERM-box response regulator transcription factor [Rhodopila globiformis]|uniref:PEP-CTERM-box response regulator transcription factor n=1 Tax=Rhodopila globiformis TaxID=1071 RepID=A0A2S6NNA5_RHOGL|nr:PEP-CTERM-box response regulator transcription factor [Rhodopila globiformis]PPQ38465.1 PEP-CTERM-box response regulator transcription factor [Rhodopila globiformis]